ncbi:hypothetical protein B9Z55_008970 [Caenorhabditis nigoni]|uniref:RING-type domain-containing protein n=1 Tax=Caenorhabditis nigoni TaxID=1611254 RepID=A0A2G5UPY2_9PELO|nr:hypothetical protein B9Z55_008970 [Caenorhabditis nigoni]
MGKMKAMDFVKLFISFLHTFSIILAILAAVSFLCFAPLELRFLISGLIFLGAFLAIFGVLKFNKFLIRTKRKKYRWEMTIGLVGITVCTTATRVLVYFLEGRIELAILLFCLNTSSCCLFHHLFILPNSKNFVYPDKISKSGKYGSLILALLHLFVLIVSIRIASVFVSGNVWSLVIFTQIFYSITSATNSIELLLFLTGNKKLVKKTAPQRISKPYPIPPNPASIPRGPINQGTQTTTTPPQYLPECQICLLPYTEKSRTPRILKNCGHTVCQVCADALERKKPRTVACPFCNTTTTVTTLNSKLPKNFAVLDILDDLNTHV